ncbi:MAG: hypothetical protein ABSA43_01285 [Candidatus Microgenomates bacterium]|jgi:hypothetical protein
MAELGSVFNQERKTNFAPPVPGGVTSPKEPFAQNPEQQKYAERAEFNRDDRGMAFGELLRTAENKPQVLLAVRQLISGYESMKYHPESGISPYSLERSIQVCQERSQALAIPVTTLQKKGIIGETVRLNDKEGSLYCLGGAGFGIGQTIVTIEKSAGYDHALDRAGRVVRLPRVVYTEQVYTDLGTESRRKEMCETFDKGYGEIIVRKNLHEAYQHFNSNTENLPGLANFYLYNWMTPEGMKLLFNLAAEEEAPEQNVGGARYDKKKQMGQMLNDAVMLYKIIGESERKQSFIDLMNRPGFKEFLVPESNPLRAEILEHWFGKPSEWVDDAKRKVEIVIKGSDGIDKKVKGKDFVKVVEKASRGRLTEFGNIWINSEVSEQGEMRIIRERVREFLGNGNADDATVKTAEELAYKAFRVFGMADEVGWQLYDDGIHTDMGTWTSSDMTKVIHPEAYQSQYGRQGRDAGPIETRGEYVGFATDLLNTVNFRFEDALHMGDKAMIFSLHECVWGYNERQGTQLKPLEPQRIGDFDQEKWDRLGDKFINSFFLRIFMAGREESGSFFQVIATNWDPRKLSDYATYEKLRKTLDVGVQASVIPENRGKLRGKSSKELSDEKRAYLEKIFASYVKGIQLSPQWGEIEGQKVPAGKGGATPRESIKVVDAIKTASSEGKIPIKITKNG